jgi:hypothetical protein
VNDYQRMIDRFPVLGGDIRSRLMLTLDEGMDPESFGEFLHVLIDANITANEREDLQERIEELEGVLDEIMGLASNT